MLFEFQSGLIAIFQLVVIGLKLWALVDAIMRPQQAYLAADKLTKKAWLWILGLAVAADLLLQGGFLLFSFIGIVAALVYLLDVRPALAAVTRRR